MGLDAELQEVLRRSCSSLGSSFVSQGGSKVLAQPSQRLLFAKTGRVDQVLGEAESLQAMFRASQAAGHKETLIPTIHAFGRTPNSSKAFLVTDYKNLSSGLSRSNQRILGQKLAQMHKNGTSENGMYGFERPTHCGATEQDNTWTQSWPDFWADRRIGELVRRSGDKELITLEAQLREKVYPLLFNEEAMRDVRPAIIHGDLWSGNTGTDEESGQPIIFDPSSSYSHNEAELGITKMFGGFGSEFYDAYHEVIPKAQPHYNERQEMYEAYHHLNHFVMFGGGYRSGTIRIFKKLIAWADKEAKRSSGGGGGGGGDDDDQRDVRGLRGGDRNAGSSMPGQSGCQSSQTREKSPPPPAAGIALSTSATSSRQMSFPPATPSQIADYFSQMVCYLWFSSGVPGHSLPTTPSRSPPVVNQPLQASPLAPRRYIPGPFHGVHPARNLRSHHAKTASAGNLSTGLSSAELSTALNNQIIAASTSKIGGQDPMLLRLQPKSRFLRFSREILRTTQVSTSVITLALIYVHRLKAAHPHLRGRDGSEFRLAISSLMLANKILDDNTYLNKTWSEISGMPLVEISKMEVEFWLGLKMELHITKEQYDKELQDLHMLASDRTRAVQQRDLAMKRALQQQQQQQLQQQQQQQQAMAQANQWMPYMQSSLSVSSDALSGLADLRQSSPMHSLSAHPPARRSVGHAEERSHGTAFPDAISPLPFSQSTTATPLYEFGPPGHTYNAHSPPYFSRPTSFTLPPSPLSQASAGVPIGPADTTTLPLALQTSLQDTLASSPPYLGSAAGDPMWSMVQQHRNPTATDVGASAAAASNTMPMSDVSPRSATSSSSFAFGDSLATARSATRPSISSHSSATTSGLKREFERANLDSGSPVDSAQYASKRFAADSLLSDDLRHYQLNLSSAMRTSQSPTETRYALRSRSRAPAGVAPSSRRSTSRDTSGAGANGFFRMSASPHHASSFSGQYPTPRRSVPRPGSAHDTHPNYHSVFSSALTPNALAAPLDNSMMELHRTSWNDGHAGGKKVGPLQYYSLAAGEPYGNIGTYLPPPLAQKGWIADYASGARRASFLTDGRNSSLGTGDAGPSSWSSRGQAMHMPVSAPGSHHGGFAMTPSSSHYTPQAPQSKDDLLSTSYPGDSSSTAPFSLDVHSWPLANATSSNFLFPYHLLPPHTSLQSMKHPPVQHSHPHP